MAVWRFCQYVGHGLTLRQTAQVERPALLRRTPTSNSNSLSVLILYVPSTIFQLFLGWTSTKLGLMCLVQGHNAVTPVRFEPAAPLSRVKHSTTEPLRSATVIGIIWKSSFKPFSFWWLFPKHVDSLSIELPILHFKGSLETFLNYDATLFWRLVFIFANNSDHDEMPHYAKVPGHKVIKLFSCSTQLSMKYIQLINVKMPTIYAF